ncbi:hypothetical protein ACFLQT_01575, partial [Bacteroidota bacterium]
GWILNSDTRDVVWHLMDDYYDWDDDEGRFNFDTEITLDAGNYEVYFAAMQDDDNGINGFGDLLESIFGGSDRRYERRYRDDLHMTVKGTAGLFTANNGNEIVDQMSNDAIVSFIRMRDDEYQKKGFTLSGETKIQIYALGEGRRSDTYDYGWIYDVKTNKRVWTMSPRFADNAGGGEKNYLIDEIITLPAGTYMVHYVTDDSHSYEEWNVLPPNDPQFWGLTLWAVSPDDMDNVKPFEESDSQEPIVEIIKVRDDRILSKGITLKKSMDVRILCLGEESSYSEMADYGWIVDADTRETVWEMEKRDTEHAGGASKNRMIDQIIRLDAGNYIVYYATDGSHSYNDWNSSPPYDRTRWGITVWAVDENNKNDVKTFDEEDYKSESVIAQIVRVRDDDYIKESFSLDRDTKVRIIAIGEGTRYDMVDYGWIKNDDTRRIVWEMTYRMTENAGGAKKNRIFNDTILLKAGDYTLYYETDGSHSYRDWNDTPPQNPEMYGITLMKED